MKNFLLFICLNSLICSSQTIGLQQHDSGSLDSGFVLFAPIQSTNTYLIDKCGKQVKTWSSTYRPGQSIYILPDGTLLRSGRINNTTFTAGGNGGIIEKMDWNGNIIWSYAISDVTKCQHHDVKALPNGNVLVIAWELKTNTQAISQGRNPALVPATVWSEQILEIQPVGATGGTVVWEWHLWDHLVQDFDNTKPNFGVVANSPKLINVNYRASATEVDWIHLNSIDYNPILDQIVVSSHSFSEIWIIDHSTTTAQAASHSGGNSGNGGDILYRWGNPLAYNNGTVANRKFWGQHDAVWITNSYPFQNQIMVFNNGNGRTAGNYSTVEIIDPPVSGFNYTATLPYLPATQSWLYNSGNPNSFYAQNISGSQQLSNGNVLMCNGPSGTFTEVTTTGTAVWKYINPVSQSGILTQGTTPTQNLVFRCSFYPSDYSGFTGRTLTAGATIENTNTLSSSCSLVLANNQNTLENKVKIYPNPANNELNIAIHNELKTDNFIVRIVNNLGQKMYENQFVKDQNIIIPTTNFAEGIYYLSIENDNNIEQQKIIIKH